MMATNEISTVVVDPKREEPRGIRLRSWPEFVEFGKVVSQTEFAPKTLRGKPVDCALAVLYGDELGVTPMAALQNIAVINGKPSVFGDLMLALCMNSPVCEFVVEKIEGEGDDMIATCSAKRRGYPAPTVRSFSMADAKAAGLLGKDGPWKQYTARMLQFRARGFALRDAFPDVLRGVISAEEAQDYPTTITVEPSSVVTSPPGWNPPRPVSGTTTWGNKPTGPTGPTGGPGPVGTTGPKGPAPLAPLADALPGATKAPAEDDSTLSFSERLSLFIRAAKSQTALANAVERADKEFKANAIDESQHKALIDLVNERAEFLRSVRDLGEPSNG